MGIDKPKEIRTWRLALTCILLFLLTWYFQVPESSWTLVTIWFVMYEYSTVGGVLNKSKARLLGTFLSVIYGIVVVYFGGNNPIIDMLALIPGLFIYTYFFMGSDKTYVGTIGAVTLTIVLLNYNDLDTALLRILNVFIGIGGSVLMIRFFYPQYARNSLIHTQITWIQFSIDMVNDYINKEIPLSTVEEKAFIDEKNLQVSFTNYDRWLTEATMETHKAPEFVGHCRAVKNQFQLLSRLLIILISYLSTEHVRGDLLIHEECSQILFKLEQIKRRLLKQIPITISSSIEVKEHVELELPQEGEQLEYHSLIQEHFKKINQMIDLLDDEVKQTVLVYNIYEFDLVSI